MMAVSPISISQRHRNETISHRALPSSNDEQTNRKKQKWRDSIFIFSRVKRNVKRKACCARIYYVTLFAPNRKRLFIRRERICSVDKKYASADRPTRRRRHLLFIIIIFITITIQFRLLARLTRSNLRIKAE